MPPKRRTSAGSRTSSKRRTGGRPGNGRRSGSARRMSRQREERLLRTVAVALVIVLLIGAAMWFTRTRGGRVFSGPGCAVTAGGGPLEYDPAQMANAATIAGVAQRRKLSPRAVTIAVATALQESKLRNIEYGDRDSLGLFQQRPSQGWGTKEQILDPVYATGQFFTHLERVKGWQTLPLTKAAQSVQRSGFPEAYAQHEDEAAAITAAVTGSTPGALVCTLDDPSEVRTPTAVRDQLQREFGITATAAGDTVRITPGSDRLAWSVGTWAVAHAAQNGTAAVSVGSRGWQRGTDERSQHWESVDGSPRAVVIRLATAR